MSKLRLALLIVLLFAVSAAAAQQTQEKIAFTHVTVIDCRQGTTKSDMTVVVTGDRITAVGASKETDPPAQARVIDCSGKFMIPGLWDMHVHLDEYSLPLYIANGVTGVRVMGGAGRMKLREAIRSGERLGPRIHQSSPILDGPRGARRGFEIITSGKQGRQAVRRYASEGRDFLKVYSDLSRDVYLAIVDEAEQQSIPFGGHVPDSVSALEASDLGQRSIEHLSGIALACSLHEEELRKQMERGTPYAAIQRDVWATHDNKRAKRLFEHFVRNKTWQVPTLTVLHWQIAAMGDRARQEPLLKYVGPGRRRSWENRFRATRGGNADYRRLFDRNVSMVREMHLAGVAFLAGTDAGNPYCFPGFSLHEELSLLVDCGFSPLEALQTATTKPAEFLGRSEELGTIEVGKRADLLLLNANPLDDIENTTQIHAVSYQAKLFDREALDRMLHDVEKVVRAKLEIEQRRAELTDEDVSRLVTGFADSRIIDLTDSRIGDRGLEALGLHVKPAILNLKGTSVTDAGLAQLTHFESLRELDLSDTGVSGPGLAHVAKLPVLQTLTLDGTRVTDASLANLGRLASLQQLNLRKTTIAGTGLRHLDKLPKLTVLFAADSTIDDQGLASICTLSSIERLGLSRTKVTDEGLVHLRGIEHLRGLGLADAKITDRGIAHLAESKELDFLNLSQNEVTDKGLSLLADLSKLESLDLSDTRISGEGLVHLGALTHLVRLHLNRTRISDSDLVHLRSLGKLRSLSLRETAVTREGILTLKQVPNLVSVDVTGCRIGEEELKELRQAVKFYLSGP